MERLLPIVHRPAHHWNQVKPRQGKIRNCTEHLGSKSQHRQRHPQTRGWYREVQAAGNQRTARRQDQQAWRILIKERL